MKMRWVRSFRPGVYIRRQIVINGEWVSIFGFLFWPNKYKKRKWAGMAAIVPVKEPQPSPTQYERHSANHESPYKVNYTPMGNNHPEGNNDRHNR